MLTSIDSDLMLIGNPHFHARAGKNIHYSSSMLLLGHPILRFHKSKGHVKGKKWLQKCKLHVQWTSYMHILNLLFQSL